MYYKINVEGAKHSNSEDEDFKNITEYIDEHNKEITGIDLNENHFEPKVFFKLIDSIKKCINLKSIKCVSLCNGLNKEEMDEVITYLCENLVDSLISLNLNSNALSCNFPTALGEFIKKAHSLKELDLGNCGIGKDGIIRIANYLDELENKKNLNILILDRNRINELDETFGDKISKFVNLKVLKIAHNTIMNGMEKFLITISENLFNLEILDISGNIIYTAKELINLINNLDLREFYIRDIITNSDEADIIDRVIEKLIIKPISFELIGDFPEKKTLILDISQNDLETDETLKLLVKLTQKYEMIKLFVFDNFFEDLSELEKKLDKSVLISENPKYCSNNEDLINDLTKLC